LTTPEADEQPSFSHPPIVEVVCGFVFDATPLNVLHWGVYWDARRGDFPKTTLQPAIIEGVGFSLGAPPMRAWLESPDSAIVLQLQHDRFYFNWRAVGESPDRSAYPRFRDRPGRPGLRTRAVEEYRELQKFTAKRFDVPLNVRRIELSKIDVLVRGTDWNDMVDLISVVPITGTFEKIHRSDEREVSLRFVEHIDGQTVVVHLSTVGAPTTGVRIESRAIAPVENDASLERAFEHANEALNEIFFTLVPSAHHRFQGEVSGA
jgi:uncharacterized protein (TIGR04255 family)